MVRQEQWNIYEAAILLEGLLQILSKHDNRNIIIKHVSGCLRQMAINDGKKIDDIFRNVNGISFQIQSMKSAYYGYTVSKPATKLFTDVVTMYRENKSKYDTILREAKDMASLNHTTEDKFVTWLSARVSPAQLSELYLAYTDVDTFCKSIKLLEEPLLKTTDFLTVKKVFKTIEKNKLFKMKYRKNLNKIIAAVRYYYNFIKEISQNVNESAVNTRIIESNYNTTKIDDEKLAKKYPLIYRKVYESLKKALEVRGSKGVSVTAIYENTHHIARSESIKEILDNASWSKIDNEGKYVFHEFNQKNEKINSELEEMLQAAEGYIENDKLEEAYSIYKDLANRGNPEAMYYIGNCYLDGEFVEQSDDQALMWFEKAAEMNYSDAVNSIGVYYHNAKNLKGKYLKAIEWYKKGAELGNKYSQCNLGWYYEYGLGCTIDLELAEKYYELSAKQGYKDAENYLIRIKKKNRKSNDTMETVKDTREDVTIRLKKYVDVLKDYYTKGFRINSNLEIKRFRKYWAEKYENEISVDDSIIVDKISRLTIQCGDFAYLPEMMLSVESKEKMLNYIKESFDQGNNAIYYNALYNKFKDIFQNERINNSEMLKTYLTYINEGLYVVKRSFIASDNNVEVDAKQEVRNLLINKGMPVNIDLIYEELPHLNKNHIYLAVSGNNSDEFVKNSKGEYFHSDIVDLSGDELEWVSEIIQQNISEKDYMSGSELVSVIENKYPDIKERYPYLTSIGLRDTIKYKLITRYSFKGQVISSIDKQLTMYEVYANYALTHSEFTLTQLNALKAELDTIIYFDAIYDNAIRINEEEFVSKDSIAFSAAETDSIIERFCGKDYIPLNNIDQFGAFPYVGYLWNKYLLESYVYSFSNKFKLMHACFNANSANGAIVKKNTSMENFDALLIDFLAKSATGLNKEDALQYFCDTGLLARKSCSTINNIIAAAGVLREQKGN